MTINYCEILRRHSLELNKKDIAGAAQCARNAASATLERVKACGLRWLLSEGTSDKGLAEKLFPRDAAGEPCKGLSQNTLLNNKLVWNLPKKGGFPHLF